MTVTLIGSLWIWDAPEAFFLASLVTPQSLNTRFTLPAAGQYTIGVFRISLVEPEKVSPTVFQVQGGLNPAE